MVIPLGAPVPHVGTGKRSLFHRTSKPWTEAFWSTGMTMLDDILVPKMTTGWHFGLPDDSTGRHYSILDDFTGWHFGHRMLLLDDILVSKPRTSQALEA